MNDDFPTNEEISAAYEKIDVKNMWITPMEPEFKTVIKVNGIPDTEHAFRILNEVIPPLLELFIQKSNRYGEPEGDDLGTAGQYADMHRKWKVLRKVMWEGKELQPGGESIEEVLFDMIGHCLKTIQFMREGK